jgi:chromosome segregation ATPase
VKALQNKITSYEVEVSELKKILEKKDEEIANLGNSKDKLSFELEDVRSKLSDLESKASKLDRLNSEVYDLKKTITLKNDELNKLRAEVDEFNPKIAELIKNNEELKKNLAEKESKITELSESLAEKEKAFNEQRNSLEKAETELAELKPPVTTEYASEERLICPSCGARGKDLKVEEDKSKVLGYVGHAPMYGKKNVCKKCSYEF